MDKKITPPKCPADKSVIYFCLENQLGLKFTYMMDRHITVRLRLLLSLNKHALDKIVTILPILLTFFIHLKFKDKLLELVYETVGLIV